jgi:preprotein translocase subunit SecB
MTNTTPAAQEVPAIALMAQYLKDLSFENLIPGRLARRELKPMTMEVRAAVEVRDCGDDLHETELFVGLTAKIDGEPAFIAELTYGASHHIVHVDPEMMRRYLNVEVARNIFPYAAAILSQTAAGAGMPPVWLDPVDFVALYNSRPAS